jgi:recombination DNA repair RAD52 pathway protein
MTPAQHRQLLAPINPRRVLKDGKGMNHVSQQDVTAHLNRVFGFGNFDTEVLSLSLIFEAPRLFPTKDEPDPKVTVKTRWDVCYIATFRLTIRNPDGSVFATYEDGATGDAQNLIRSEAHDLAMKTAISTAKKRCAINLGDQFGLSLYNKGSMEAIVMRTLLDADFAEDEEDCDTPEDVTEGVEQQVSLGVDETEVQADLSDEQVANLSKTLGAKMVEQKS